MFVTKRMGGGYVRVGQPGQKEPGRRERLPHTATIKRSSRHKKAPALGTVALVRLLLNRVTKPGR